jgi:hypothetical protein
MSVRPTERQLRTFCLLYAVVFICFAVFIASLRFLIAQGEALQPLLLAQEEICAVVLIFLAALLLRVRGALRGPHIVRIGRSARAGTITAALLCVVGLCIVLVVPLSGEITAGKFPTIAVSALTLFFAAFAYAGLSKLPR